MNSPGFVISNRGCLSVVLALKPGSAVDNIKSLTVVFVLAEYVFVLLELFSGTKISENLEGFKW